MEEHGEGCFLICKYLSIGKHGCKISSTVYNGATFGYSKKGKAYLKNEGGTFVFTYILCLNF
jgi:hypothetical protein